MTNSARNPLRPLKGIRILSLALNLPGPAALMRLRQMGANCTKLEPPARPDGAARASADPMAAYSRVAFDAMHQGIKVRVADLKTRPGQTILHQVLARSDVLLTSFRPSALKRLGLTWPALHRRYPTLGMVSIVGSPGPLAEEPGHDLTYLAQSGLVQGLNLPPTLFADMGGALLTCEAVLQLFLHRQARGTGAHLEVALSEAADFLALPQRWGLMGPTQALGGGHAGYGIYPCKDGRVALAALEPHFAAALADAAGLKSPVAQDMFSREAAVAIGAFVAKNTRAQLQLLSKTRDIPLHTLD